MKNLFASLFMLWAIFCIMPGQAISQVIDDEPLVITGKYHGLSRPLRELPQLTEDEFNALVEKGKNRLRSQSWEPKQRLYPFAETALPKDGDPIRQTEMGTVQNRPVFLNFDGQTSPYKPSDVNGDVNETHYFQTINTVYAIYNKTGQLVAGPTNLNLLFEGVTGSQYNDGDPIVLWDEAAQRWLVAEFSVTGSNDYMLVAVSTTADPTGTWHRYSFDVDDMPDYPKLGVWRDGYYMGTNTSTAGRKDIYVLERSKMLTGATAQMVGFKNSLRPNSGFHCVPPVDNDGTLAPEGSPGIFITINDDAWGGSDQIWIYELNVNWTTPSSSTFARTQQINVPAFDSNFGSSWDNIAQKGTTQKLDAVNQVIMHRPQYRNFGTHQAIVACHTVDVSGTDQAGVRWYELRRTGTGPWSIRQTGTYAPDNHSRWMGSIAMTPSGKIGLMYSISSTTLNPGLRFTGQSSAAYAAGNGIMDVVEEVILEGTLSQTGTNRWGDYFMLAIDPSDNETFWATGQYVGSGNAAKTRIASFKIGNAPIVSTLAATNVTLNSATLNGTVNPNTLSTTYYFEWGTSTSYGNNTTVTNAGSGSTAQNVSANLSGLIAGQTYHFRIVATNADGTSYGNNQTFTPGGVMLTTAAITNLQTNSATSGGNITSDGGSPITARGVCWGTTANPVIGSGNFTSDGTGIGTFVSNIQGLSSNTVYYVRAYATNSFGTFYGDNVSFQTLCGLITNFPWTEGFENGGNIPACWTQEQVNNSGVNWQFITGNGTGYPANAYSGTYNACLKDNTSADNKTRLITPPIDLSNLSNPVLTFYHTQAFWSPDQDILTVFYRTSSTGTWIQLAQYTSNVTTWTLRTINLPNPSSEYYIAFEGNAKYGRGVCVDEVTVNGTSSTPNLSVTPSNQNQSASAGSVNFTVTSNVSWNAVSNQSWCTVTPSGSGNGTLVATVTENTNPTQRIAQITVSATGVSDVIVTVTQAAAAQTPFANVLLRPQQADIASTTSQGAVLMQVGNYTSNDAKYRLFNGSNQYNVWNGSQYVTSNTYADNPSIPGTPTTGSTWWIVYQRGTNNSVTASYRDRLSPYSANHLTTALPAATAIVTPVTINGTIPFSASYPLNVKYVILGYDAPTGGNLISATSSDLTTGAFALVVEQGTVIQRLEVRNLLNELMESQTGTWPGGNPPTLFTLSGGGSYCQGTSPTGISASLSGSETNATYQLLRNSLPYGDPVSGTGNPILWNNLIAGTYTVTATNSSSQTMNGQAVVTETPSVAVSVTIQASATDVCQGTAVSFTSTAQNAGNSPVYQWTVNGNNAGTNSPGFSYTPANGDQVQLLLTSSENCAQPAVATSNTVILSVQATVLVSVNIQASATDVCQGTPVSFTSTAQNAGNSPVYQWTVNGNNAGTNSPGFSYTPANGDQVQLLLTSSENCAQPAVATSNTVTISVQTPPVAVISILPSQNPVCQGTQVTFNAQLLNGGTNPTIQWYVNSSLQSSGTALSFSYVPNNNDVVEAVMTSTLSCVSNNPALSNGIIMEVSPMLIPQVSISTPSTTLCNGQQANVTAIPVNGGTSPVYQWLLNGNPAGTNSPTFTFVPANGNQLALSMSSSLACISGNPATSNTLTFTVNPVALSLNVSPSGAGTANFTGTPTIGQPIQLSASPSAGFNFQSWTDGLGNVVSTQANFSFTPTLCNHSLTANFSSGITLSGKLAYFNPIESSLPPQSNFMVQLFDGSNPVGAPQAVSPNYSFGGLQAGKAYTIRLWEDHTSGNLGQTWNFNNWGGVSALDALIVSYMSSENPVVATFPWILPVAGQPMTPFATTSADVNNSNSITGLDALIMMYRTIGYPGTSPFPDGKHNFQVAGRWSGSAGAMLYPTAPDILLQPNGSYQASSATASVYYQALLPNTINGANYFNIYLLANGDLNASYTPAAVSAKNGAILSYEGSIPASVGQTINIPVRINQSHRLAAITLGLSYNKQLLEVNGLQGFDIFYVDQQAGEVRVAWMDQQGRDYASGQSLLNIQAKVTGNIQPGTRFMELTNITEFVNTGAQTLSNVPLASDYIATGTTGLPQHNVLSHKVMPNPFSREAVLQVNIPFEGLLEIVLVNSLGQYVKSIHSGQVDAGLNTFRISANGLDSGGIYYYIIRVSSPERFIQKQGTLIYNRE